MTINCFIRRRIKLIKQMKILGGGIAIITSAPKMIRSGDIYYPYKQNNYFYYLSGFMESNAVIVLIAGQYSRSILFCQDNNLKSEIWNGFRFGPTLARKKFNFEEAFSINELEKKISQFLIEVPATIFYTFGYDVKFDKQLHQWLKKIKFNNKILLNFININVYLNELRLFKDIDEINTMRRAASISAAAHCLAMRNSRPGLCEYHLEADLLYIFRKYGSQFPAYNSIVAAGANACILHYSTGNNELKNGALVLIDAGCELDNYAADITRTFPVNGLFSKEQKKIYEIVLTAQESAISETYVGNSFINGHNAAVRVLAQGMLDIGLLNKNKVGSLEDVLINGDYRKFYMHRTGHWLGMDVHDVGNYHEALKNKSNEYLSRILQPGMVLTIEPGIYIRPAVDIPRQYWNIAVRIEDDVYVTQNGCEILSIDVPKKISDIEALMNNNLTLSKL